MHRRANDRASESARDDSDGLRAQAFAGAPIGLGIVDRTHRLVEANPALQQVLGDAAIAGGRLADLVADGNADAVTGVLEALRHGGAGQRTCISAASAARNQPVLLTLSPLTAADGRQHVLVVAELDDRWSGKEATSERLAALSQSALGRRGHAALMHEAAATVLDVLEADGVCVMTRAGSDPDAAAMRLRASIGMAPPVGAVFAVSPQGPAGQVMITGEPVLMGSPLGSPETDALPYAASWYAEGIRSAAFVPLGPANAPDGVLAALSGDPRAFTPSEVQFARDVATLLTIDAERRRRDARARHEALHDPLTGLPNRTLFDDRLEVALRSSGRHDLAVGVVLLDLDGFKDVNDSLGHAAGDRLLCEVAERLRHVLRAGDTIARLGGDEFGICLPGPLDRREVAHVAERLIASLEEPFHLSDLPVRVAASCGVATAPDHGRAGDTLLHRADVAMYRAKRERLGWCWWDPDVDTARADRLAGALELRRALVQDELQLHYQPVIDARTGAVTGVEALLRWPHPERGLLLPDDILPVAGDAGLAQDLACWVVRRAAGQAAAWAPTGGGSRSDGPMRPVPISVNLTDGALAGEEVVEILLDELDRYGLPGSSLAVEVTFTGLRTEALREGLQRLTDAGLSIALDGFGNDDTSLASLRDLPLQVVKLDRSLTTALDRSDGTGRRHRAIVSGVIALGHSLGVRVAVVGLETPDAAAQARAAGADLLQGYLWGPPMPAGEAPPGRESQSDVR
jgi:diguanylate cyclase (GGDEF)-like protein